MSPYHILFVYLYSPTVATAAGSTPSAILGSASTYGVLARAGVTNTGATTISGTAGNDVGSAPTDSFTGFADGFGTVTMTGGVLHHNDAAAIAAKAALDDAYADLSTRGTATTIPTDLISQNVGPGIYSSLSGTFENTGTFTLNGGGDPNAIFIFQAATTVKTAADIASKMVLIGSAQACNVYWTVGSSATIEVGSTFIGHILAFTSITAKTGANITGQLLARGSGGVGGAVTLGANTITNNNCAAPVPAPAPAPAITYRVTYCGNTSDGGVVPIDWANPYYKFQKTIVLGNLGSLTKTGNTFGNWNTAADGTGTSYAPGSTLTVLADTILCAQWSPTPVATPTPTPVAAPTPTPTPVAAPTPTPTPVATPTPAALATLHVVKVVVNRNGGTAVPSDFTLHVTLHGVDVVGSPAVGMGGAGRSYTLAPGSYGVTEEPVAGYGGRFSGTNITSGFVTLEPGADVTITRTNSDATTQVAVITAPAPAPAPAPAVTAPAVTATVTGGELPKTGSPWYNLLALGTTLILVGGVSWAVRRRRA